MASRHLTEAYTSTTPLRVDREAGIIYGVRCLGSESKNTYGVPGVIATEYSDQAHADARRMYEGSKSYANHNRDKRNQERRAEDLLGVFRNCETKNVDGKPVTFADFHYFKSNKLAESVAEDAERGMGAFGFSHDAFAGSERVDKARKKLVIESLKSVNSIDLVTKPATNRNLSESQEPTMKTLKSILESLPDLPPGKSKWARRLIEDTTLRTALESEAESMTAGFEAAVGTIVMEPAIPAAEKSARIARLLESQEHIESSTDSEPPAIVVVEERKVTESADELAKLKAENAALKAENTVRQLCESEGFTPKPHQLKSIQLLESEAERKALIADLKGAAKELGAPRSGFRRVTESETAKVADVKSFVALIKK